MFLDLVVPWSKVPYMEHPTNVQQNINDNQWFPSIWSLPDEHSINGTFDQVTTISIKYGFYRTMDRTFDQGVKKNKYCT